MLSVPTEEILFLRYFFSQDAIKKKLVTFLAKFTVQDKSY